MLKRIAFVLVVCTCVSVAFGAAVRITAFEIFDPEDKANANVMAILNYVSGQDKTIVQIIMSDFTANEGYWLSIGSFTSLGPVIFTDEYGHATFHSEILFGDKSGSDVELYVDDNEYIGTLEPDELRASSS